MLTIGDWVNLVADGGMYRCICNHVGVCERPGLCTIPELYRFKLKATNSEADLRIQKKHFPWFVTHTDQRLIFTDLKKIQQKWTDQSKICTRFSFLNPPVGIKTWVVRQNDDKFWFRFKLREWTANGVLSQRPSKRFRAITEEETVAEFEK